MNEDRIVTTHENSSPFLTPPIIAPPSHEHVEQHRAANREAARIASREEAQREEALSRAMNPPRTPKLDPPRLRQPVLSDNALHEIDALDAAVFGRGIAVGRERLVSLGKQRFEELRALDRDVRAFQRILFVDLSQWHSVEQSFAIAGALSTSVPRVRTAEASRGGGVDRIAAASITDFDSLWKAQAEPQSVRNVLKFRRSFESLIFGQSLLQRISDDGRVRSHFFSSGRESKQLPFEKWLSVLQRDHFSVRLVDPFAHLFWWLCGERVPLLDTLDLAREFFSVRIPSDQQLRVAQAIFHAFLLGYREWELWGLWDFVGRETQQVIDIRELEYWRTELVRRCPAIAHFHSTISDFFWRDVGNAEGHRKVDANACRDYIKREMQVLQNRLSALTALALDELMPNSIVARFSDLILVEHEKPKAFPLIERIERKLATAFANARFKFNVNEVA